MNRRHWRLALRFTPVGANGSPLDFQRSRLRLGRC